MKTINQAKLHSKNAQLVGVNEGVGN